MSAVCLHHRLRAQYRSRAGGQTRPRTSANSQVMVIRCAADSAVPPALIHVRVDARDSRPGYAGRKMDYAAVQNFIDRLVTSSSATVAFVLDRNGRLLAASGDVDNLDSTSIAEVIAGDTAAKQAAAKQLKESGELYVQADTRGVYIQLLGNRVLCVAYLDQRSSLGLVRLHSRKAGEQLIPTLNTIDEFTNSDIDSLFQ